MFLTTHNLYYRYSSLISNIIDRHNLNTFIFLEIGKGRLTVGKIYGGLLILENWKATKFGKTMSGDPMVRLIFIFPFVFYSCEIGSSQKGSNRVGTLHTTNCQMNTALPIAAILTTNCAVILTTKRGDSHNQAR